MRFGGWVFLAAGACALVGCGGKSVDVHAGGSDAQGGTTSTGGASATIGAAGEPGVGGSATTGALGGSNGLGGSSGSAANAQGPGGSVGAGANASGFGGGGGSNSSAGDVGEAGALGGELGDACSYRTSTSELTAMRDFYCTGSCLWDGRYWGESYCTIDCAGAPAICPDDFECTEDQNSPTKYWCARTMPKPPPDLGVPCTQRPGPYSCATDYADAAFCGEDDHDECSAKDCVEDVVAAAAYCTTPCADGTGRCPDGWDCTGNQSGTCVKHHDPSAYVGRRCEPGIEYGCSAATLCLSDEDGKIASCGLKFGTCLDDRRSGVKLSDYCTLRCEETPCPTGYECADIMTATGAPASGKYCIEQL
jgi:hypothetical protein